MKSEPPAVAGGLDSFSNLICSRRQNRFIRRSNDERDALLRKTQRAAGKGEFEPFKTSSIFDGTAGNPEWLGDEPREISRARAGIGVSRFYAEHSR